MRRAGFPGWDGQALRQAMRLFVPQGFFLVAEKGTGTVIAMMAARHVSEDRHEGGADIGWLTADASHAGHGLGYILTAATTNRLIEVGYKRIYVKTGTTSGYRPTKPSSKAGFIPDLYHEELHGRWKSISAKIGLTFQPDLWLKFKQDLHEDLRGEGTIPGAADEEPPRRRGGPFAETN